MQLDMQPKNNVSSGIGYFFDGVRLLTHPQLRIYILVPLIVNCVLFFVLTGLLFSYLSSFMGGESGWIPEWLAPWIAPFKWIAWIIFGALFFIVYAYSFNMITNIIAAPFYGLLAEKAEHILTGQAPAPESLSRMIPRVMLRELQKLMYFLLRGVLIILVMITVGFIPLLQFAAPLIGLAWGAWSMTIQYADYPADNHKVAFRDLRMRLWQRTYSSLGFGGSIMACSLIPFVNIFAMPAAVAGGTIYWVNELKKQQESNGTKNTS